MTLKQFLNHACKTIPKALNNGLYIGEYKRKKIAFKILNSPCDEYYTSFCLKNLVIKNDSVFIEFFESNNLRDTLLIPFINESIWYVIKYGSVPISFV